jgi:hypothetical protein
MTIVLACSETFSGARWRVLDAIKLKFFGTTSAVTQPRDFRPHRANRYKITTFSSIRKRTALFRFRGEGYTRSQTIILGKATTPGAGTYE